MRDLPESLFQRLDLARSFLQSGIFAADDSLPDETKERYIVQSNAIFLSIICEQNEKIIRHLKRIADTVAGKEEE